MIERERNRRLINLIVKLNTENNTESIELLKSMVDNDTDAMKKTFEILIKSTPISDFFGLNNLSELK